MRRRLEDFLHQTWSSRGLVSDMLLPFSLLYGCISRRHMQSRKKGSWRAPVPVVVVGNIMAGGTGKTPVTIAVCKALQAADWKPGIISRGYGIRIGPRPHLSCNSTQAGYLGDEPALIHTATGAPVAVHPRRILAASALLEQHPEVDVLLSDDGLQHTALARDIEIIVQDARGTGNGRLLPAGPLREPPQRLLEADWLITNAYPHMQSQVSAEYAPAAQRCISMQLRPLEAEHLASGRRQDWAGWLAGHGSRPCAALAGIGQPDRFFSMLRLNGLQPYKTLRIADHQPVSPGQLQEFGPGPILITLKDAIKCRQPADERMWVIHTDTEFSDPTWLSRLESRLREPGDKP